MIIEWNNQWVEITGFSREEVMGKSLVDEYITEDFREAPPPTPTAPAWLRVQGSRFRVQGPASSGSSPEPFPGASQPSPPPPPTAGGQVGV